MTFDVTLIAGQIARMVDTLDPQYDAHRFNMLREAWNHLDSREVDSRMSTARTTFLIPHQHPDFKERAHLPSQIDDYSVVGTDGSFILPDRHSPARYYLINTGSVILRYGANSSADFQCDPQLFFEDSDLVVPDDVHRLPVNGPTIGPKRAADELASLEALLEQEKGVTLGLQDGTLILWSLETLPDSVANWTLPVFLDALEAMRDREQPVASYISAPGSNELMNTLRIAVCDYPDMGKTINCDDCRSRRTPACDVLPFVTDRYLFSDIADLEDGERSAIYRSRSKILRKYVERSDDFAICYFYINTGLEIGRVEIPYWVARNSRQLDLVHRIVYDQCQRGRGYPIVLQEAHEMAVLSSSDRRMIEDMIERKLASTDIVLTRTGKDGSKRVRFV